MDKITIKNRAGRIMGWVKVESNGDKVATDSAGRIVGYYKAARNVTTKTSGEIYAWGDVVASLIPIQD